MGIKSKGTQIYFIDVDGTTVVKIGCPTAIPDIGGKRSTSSEACLDASAKTVRLGLVEYNSSAIPIMLDPTDASHQKALALFESGNDQVQFAIGYSDGTDVPTATAGVFTLPTTRTFISFTGGVSEWKASAAVDSSITADLSVQICGNFAVSWKA